MPPDYPHILIWQMKKLGFQEGRCLASGLSESYAENPGFLILRLKFTTWWWKESIHTVNHKIILKIGKAPGGQGLWFLSRQQKVHPAPLLGHCNRDHGVLTLGHRTVKLLASPCLQRIELDMPCPTPLAVLGSPQLLFPCTKDMKWENMHIPSPTFP